MTADKKIYFASDFHLGLEVGMKPLDREKHIVKWMKSVAGSASAIYLVGDIFDFWWEYKSVVPKGFTRFLGTISELTDSGIEIHFFTGNHDMWISDYLSKECGMTLHTEPLHTELMGKKFYIAHGEGLGSGDRSYKILLWLFRNRMLRKMYSFLHPRIGLAIAHRWTKKSRLAKHHTAELKDPDNESLIKHARQLIRSNKVDYFIFGHRHIALEYKLATDSTIFFLGNWFDAPAYVSWDGREAVLHMFNYH
ncbi:MAG: UDP-2,3-diacylglucosamine diphosphatase [Bacteroidales bacterium]|nr:UDP-2,3-diacylglucosamine diphosphatase [Bacteroidales bacterium]